MLMLNINLNKLFNDYIEKDIEVLRRIYKKYFIKTNKKYIKYDTVNNCLVLLIKEKYYTKYLKYKINTKNENLIYSEEKINELKNQIKVVIQKKDLLKIRNELKESYNIYKNMPIASIDCEYKSINNKYYLSEIGYTIKNLKNKKLYSKHFIIKNSYKKDNKRFIYGFSKYISLEEALKETEKDLKNVKLIVGNSIQIEMSIFNFFGIELEKNKKIIDLKDFFTYFTKQKEINPSLSVISKLMNIEPFGVHNAGNDSYYGIQAFCRLIRRYNECTYENLLKDLNKGIKIDINRKPEFNKTRKSILFNSEYQKFNGILEKKSLIEVQKEEMIKFNELKNYVKKEYKKIVKNSKEKIFYSFSNKIIKEIFNNPNSIIVLNRKMVPLLNKESAFLYMKEMEKSLNFKLNLKNFLLEGFVILKKITKQKNEINKKDLR